MVLLENLLAERSVVHAPVQLCLDLGHPFVSGGSPADCDPYAVLDTLAGAGVTDVLLILEVIPPFEADDRQVIADLRASADLWRSALDEWALAERNP